MQSDNLIEDNDKLLYLALNNPELDFLAYPRDYTTKIQNANGEVIGLVKPDEMIIWKCEACTKKFATKQSLERHHDRFEHCKNWKEGDTEIPTESVFLWVNKLVDSAICEKTCKTCKYCSTEFSNVGNFKKHFRVSLACNRLAYIDVREVFTKA